MDRQRQANRINAADVEHLSTLLIGSLLLASGLAKKGPVGATFKWAGTALLLRGVQGYKRIYDLFGLKMARRPSGIGDINVRVDSAIVIERPCSEVYRIIRNLGNLPVFMDHLLEVKEQDDRLSRWTAKAPAGMSITWDAEIINDLENELIAFRTIEGSGVDMAGSVHFKGIGHATKVRVLLRYDPPADMLGVWIAKIFRNDPQTQIDQDLLRLKKILELANSPKRRDRS